MRGLNCLLNVMVLLLKETNLSTNLANSSLTASTSCSCFLWVLFYNKNHKEKMKSYKRRSLKTRKRYSSSP